MEVAFAFGAVGDFIAVGQLIKDIVCALDDCRGSAKEYRDVVQGLAALRKALDEVERIYRDPKLSDGFEDLCTIALRTVEQVRQCLEGFRNQIRKYGPSLADGGTGNLFKDVARKIQWKLEEKDVDKFRADVAGSTISLKVLLEVTTVRIVQRNHEASTQQVADSENRAAILIRASRQSLKGCLSVLGGKILSKLDFVSRLGTDLKRSTGQILSMMFAVSGELSSIRAVVMRLDRGVSDEHFVLEDATGRAFPIHLKTITSWEVFEYVLNDRFKGKKGAHRIRRKLYSLQERATRREVDRTANWENAFLPYQRVNMSLMCREADKNRDTRLLSCCPWCKTTSTSEIGVEVQRQNCNMSYTRAVELDDDDALPQAPTAPRRTFDVRFGETSFNTGTKRQRDDDNSDEDETTCAECHQTKRRKGQERRKRKRSADDPNESGSDDEDVRGFVRITLVSKRRQTAHPNPNLPFQATHAESFDSMTEKIVGDTGSKAFMGHVEFKPAHVSLRTGDESLLDPDDDDQASNSDQDGDDEGESQDREEPEPYDGQRINNKNMSSDASSAQASTQPTTGNEHAEEWEIQKVRKATEEDVRKHGLGPGLSLKNWDPTEEPIQLLGSVFDANSLGKWIYDWTVYHQGPATPLSDMAGELWLLLIQLAGKIRRSEEVIGRVPLQESRDMLEEFIESGERLFEQLRSLLRACEAPMLKAAKRKQCSLGRNAGVEFVDTLFRRDRELDRTEKLMRRVRLFNLRFDAYCESIIRNPERADHF